MSVEGPGLFGRILRRGQSVSQANMKKPSRRNLKAESHTPQADHQGDASTRATEAFPDVPSGASTASSSKPGSSSGGGLALSQQPSVRSKPSFRLRLRSRTHPAPEDDEASRQPPQIYVPRHAATDFEKMKVVSPDSLARHRSQRQREAEPLTKTTSGREAEPGTGAASAMRTPQPVPDNTFPTFPTYSGSSDSSSSMSSIRSSITSGPSTPDMSAAPAENEESKPLELRLTMADEDNEARTALLQMERLPTTAIHPTLKQDGGNVPITALKPSNSTHSKRGPRRGDCPATSPTDEPSPSRMSPERQTPRSAAIAEELAPTSTVPQFQTPTSPSAESPAVLSPAANSPSPVEPPPSQPEPATATSSHPPPEAASSPNDMAAPVNGDADTQQPARELTDYEIFIAQAEAAERARLAAREEAWRNMQARRQAAQALLAASGRPVAVQVIPVSSLGADTNTTAQRRRHGDGGATAATSTAQRDDEGSRPVVGSRTGGSGATTGTTGERRRGSDESGRDGANGHNAVSAAGDPATAGKRKPGILANLPSYTVRLPYQTPSGPGTPATPATAAVAHGADSTSKTHEQPPASGVGFGVGSAPKGLKRQASITQKLADYIRPRNPAKTTAATADADKENRPATAIAGSSGGPGSTSKYQHRADHNHNSAQNKDDARPQTSHLGYRVKPPAPLATASTFPALAAASATSASPANSAHMTSPVSGSAATTTAMASPLSSSTTATAARTAAPLLQRSKSLRFDKPLPSPPRDAVPQSSMPTSPPASIAALVLRSPATTTTTATTSTTTAMTSPLARWPTGFSATHASSRAAMAATTAQCVTGGAGIRRVASRSVSGEKKSRFTEVDLVETEVTS